MADRSPVSALRAPREDGAVLAEPPLDSIPALVEQNRRALAGLPGQILGRDLRELRWQAQESALRAAEAYLQQGGEPLPARAGDGLILAGHQPELFHPGVWVKNFALHRAARQLGVTPVNLVVDNDIVKATALTVPAAQTPLPPVEQAHVARLGVPFDAASAEIPYELYSVRDEALFASLPQRTPTDWGFTPLLPEFWSEVLRQARRTPLLGERFAAARRTFERRWGCHNLELPISSLCQTEPFVWFFCHLLENVEQVHQVYNQTVRDYRRRYGLRSRNHPVPDLASEGDWLELPFWAWQAGQTRRGRLFARRQPDRIALRVGNDTWPALGRGASLVQDALALVQSGRYAIRSRALTNTLFARVFLCDLFIHGLGGGKYDELTDHLIHRLYGIEPPGYLVLSATLLLPVPTYPATAADCRQLQRRARDLHYNPQRHLDAMLQVDGRVRELVRRKQELIELPYSSIVERQERMAHLQQVTEQLRSYLANAELAARQGLERCEREVRANALLRDRDYAFCLYPEDKLRPFVTQFL